MPGDYQFWRRQNHDKTTDAALAAATSNIDGVIAVKNLNYTLFIQKISYNVVTSAAQSVSFEDSGTPLKIATVPASQTTPIVFDFGPKGVALAQGKNLNIKNTAGPAAEIHIEAYEKRTAVIAHDAANQ